jgi:hypothetical protein
VPAAALIQVFKAGYGSERPRMVRGVFRERLSLVKGPVWWEVLKTR